MVRAESQVIDGLGARQLEMPMSPAAAAGASAASPVVVDRLIGDQPARWWALAGSWLALAFSVGFGLFVNFQAQGREATLGASLMAMIPHYLVWVLASPPLYRALHMTIEGVRRLHWFAALVGWSLTALAGSTVMSYLSYSLRHDLSLGFAELMDLYVYAPVGPAFHSMNMSILALALAAFAIVRGLRLRDHAQWEAAQAELRGARLEAQLAEARLQVLQSQINPHFLLNALNAVGGLVQSGERDRAFDAIGRIGELLQIAMQSGSQVRVTLGDEIGFLERYLQLCQLRFGAGFRYRLSVPAALCELHFPALVVQPLVENAIRHGMDPPRPLTVEVRAWREGRKLVIEVEDDGRGPPAAGVELRPGHGLANVAERLQLYFGPRSSLLLEPRAPRGTRARLSIG
jgi:signal transduction histidine kinase